MKLFAIIAAVAVVAWLGWRLSAPPNTSALMEVGSIQKAEPPSQSITDATVVFRQAFWKNPGPDDRILNAERREWSGPDGLKKWQWFIVVQPSAQLLKYLRDENAFSLVQSKPTPVAEDAPAWFHHTAEAADQVMINPMGGMYLAFSSSASLLYATDSGDGFRPGASEAPPAPVAQASTAGRLPVTAPPAPQSSPAAQ